MELYTTDYALNVSKKQFPLIFLVFLYHLDFYSIMALFHVVERFDLWIAFFVSLNCDLYLCNRCVYNAVLMNPTLPIKTKFLVIHSQVNVYDNDKSIQNCDYLYKYCLVFTPYDQHIWIKPLHKELPKLLMIVELQFRFRFRLVLSYPFLPLFSCK